MGISEKKQEKHTDIGKWLAVGTLAVLTAGTLYAAAPVHEQTVLAAEAAWEAEQLRLAEEEAARLAAEEAQRRAELEAEGYLYVYDAALTCGTDTVPLTDYLPTRLKGEEQTADLAAALAALDGGALAEGSGVTLLIPNRVPSSIMIWRDPVGQDTPAESVNYTRQEAGDGVQCSFTVTYGDHEAVEYRFDIKIDDMNQGKLGFTAVCPKVQEG